MHFPFDPEMTFGPWMFYIAFAVTFHATVQAGLAVLGVFWRRGALLLQTLGVAMAISSALGFLLSFAWGSKMEDPEEAMVIAYNISLGALAGGPLIFAWALARWRELYEEMSAPSWTALTNLSGCTAFACLVGLNFSAPFPQLQTALVLLMLLSMVGYWSVLLLLPWKFLTRMDPMNLVSRLH